MICYLCKAKRKETTHKKQVDSDMLPALLIQKQKTKPTYNTFYSYDKEV